MIEYVYARVAQLVEYDLAKVGVAGSSPVSRSFILQALFSGLFLVDEHISFKNKICRPILQADIFVLITSKYRIIQIIFLS